MQVLTVNSYTYTNDHRFSSHSSSDADEWVLKITKAGIEDSGGYECQVSTETKMSLTFELEVVGENSDICHYCCDVGELMVLLLQLITVMQISLWYYQSND